MNILVLGGSYFLGKHFVNMAADEHTITVFNRGNRPVCFRRSGKLLETDTISVR